MKSTITTLIDGYLDDWTPGSRIDRPGDTPSDVSVYARSDGDYFSFGLTASVEIGANTTFWLNTDRNAATGYQIFGFAGGAEYNVNFAADGTASLYSGGAGETLVTANLQLAYSPDHRTVEFRVAKADIGNPAAIDTLIDLNDSHYLPTSYSDKPLTVYADPVIDGNLDNWTAADRIDRPGSGADGVSIYARSDGAYFDVALAAPVQIGANTTAWLNTDRDASTGYQIFGFAGGAEYNVNFAADGTASLYSGGAGETLVAANLQLAYSPDHRIVEFRVAKADIGNPNAVDTLWDLNDRTYLPSSYSDRPYTVFNETGITPDASTRVGIVFSDTTAKNFFSETAYSQLFMAVQSQVAQSGTPFDVLTEADLTNLAKLAHYDTLIFPSFRNVDAAKVNLIANTLEQATKQFGIGLVAAGDFMTNDAQGQALTGDSYARMKLLFDATRVTGGFPADIKVTSADANHLVFDGLADGEVIRDYSGVAWSAYGSVSGHATTLANQTIDGQTYTAALATQTGGRNVLFSSESVMADSNLLWQAVDYSVNGTGVSVGLQLTRQTGIVASRTDMDQSQQLTDVKPENGGPGIYDKLLPILQQWKADYDFVGSYYVNVGNQPADGRATDWGVSAPYYKALLDLGNEIGTHSYTHPENTNILTPEEIRFEFEASKLAIEQQMSNYLGHTFTIDGAAVPGAPESLATSEEIAKYVNYLSGGYSGIGAGYPGAIGYLTANPGEKVYIAPSTSFDFTLIEFQHKTVAEAEAAWAQEWTSLTANAKAPVIVWPWHDYGATEWSAAGNVASSYSTEMFTNWIARAHESGAEFVTLADLADRVSSFSHSSLTRSINGDVITASVTSQDAGRFALDVSGQGAKVIQSVDGWYAYGDHSVYLPATGGDFTIRLGAVADDVTHITALPMRASLLSVNGDGRNLAFSVEGEGKVTIDLAATGTNWISVSGASIAARAGELLTLDLGVAGPHSVLVTYVADTAPGFAANGRSSFAVAEGSVTVGAVAATDGETALGDMVTYSLTGDDARLFTIDRQTGLLAFVGAPDYYAPADANRDNVYLVSAIATDAFGLSSQKSLTITVGSVNSSPTGGVTVTGTAREGSVLSASNTLADRNGLGPIGYQWQRDGVDIAGATGSTYTIATGDVAHSLRVVAHYVDGGGTPESVASVAIADIAPLPFLTGTAAADILTAGNDENWTINGLGGNDTLTGRGGADLLDGGDGDDALSGGAGNDTLDGGGGSDRLVGGAGNDIYVVDAAGDVVTEQANEGTDTVRTTLNAYTLGANLENLTFTGTGAFAGTGNALANTITGGAGNDTLDGKAGADTLVGGAGNDTYVVDNAGDIVTEAADEGIDTVTASVSYTLSANIENLTLATGAANGTGNALDNRITGNAAANTLIGGGGTDYLDGGAGKDTLIGGTGNDTYVVDATGDTVTEQAGEGTDLVRTALATYTLGANVENLTYTGTGSFAGTGNADANAITGGAGNDTLDGKAGADTLDGGLGNDTYVVDDAGDAILDSGGTDLVRTTLAAYTLGANVENLTYTGTGNFTGTGNALANTITGGAGNDRLDGGAGRDTLIGGAGDDTYVVDNSADVVIEGTDAGIDTVHAASAAYTLGANIENLTFTGTGAFTGTGNASNNVIQGGALADTLNGGAGIDTLIGFDGNDIYVVDVAGDIVVEAANGGIDTVRSTAASYTLGDNVENLVILTGGINATGNDLANSMTGNSGNNRIDGGAGADTMAGGKGNDTYVVDNAGDVVTESANSGTDTIETALASYTLKANVENLVYTGTGNFTGIGTSVSNSITGGQGNDTIDGGDGLDMMTGLAGNDTYVVNRADDQVIEAVNGGTDQVLSTADKYTLAANVENLRLTGTGKDATGNALDNQIVGNGGANILDGGAGADELRGGSGNDTFVFRAGQAGGDKVADFTGAGAAVGDKLQFYGFGQGTIAQVGNSDVYTITSADHSIVETIQLLGVYNLNTAANGNDYAFG